MLHHQRRCDFIFGHLVDFSTLMLAKVTASRRTWEMRGSCCSSITPTTGQLYARVTMVRNEITRDNLL